MLGVSRRRLKEIPPRTRLWLLMCTLSICGSCQIDVKDFRIVQPDSSGGRRLVVEVGIPDFVESGAAEPQDFRLDVGGFRVRPHETHRIRLLKDGRQTSLTFDFPDGVDTKDWRLFYKGKLAPHIAEQSLREEFFSIPWRFWVAVVLTVFIFLLPSFKFRIWFVFGIALGPTIAILLCALAFAARWEIATQKIFHGLGIVEAVHFPAFMTWMVVVIARQSRSLRDSDLVQIRKVAAALNSWKFEEGDASLRRLEDSARRLGRKVHRAGGMSLMVGVLNTVREEGIYTGALEKYWNGIGDFRG